MLDLTHWVRKGVTLQYGPIGSEPIQGLEIGYLPLFWKKIRGGGFKNSTIKTQDSTE